MQGCSRRRSARWAARESSCRIKNSAQLPRPLHLQAACIALKIQCNSSQSPPVPQVRCVRADSVTPVELKPNGANWILMPHKQRTAVAGWLVEERTATFSAVVHDGTPQRLEGFRLTADEDGDGVDDELFSDQALAGGGGGGDGEGPAAAPPKPMHVSVKVGQTNLLVRNLLRTPILELEMSEVKIGERRGVGIVLSPNLLSPVVLSPLDCRLQHHLAAPDLGGCLALA